MKPSRGRDARRWLAPLAGAALLVCSGCGGAAVEPTGPAESAGSSDGAESAEDAEGAQALDAETCPGAYEDYVQAWSRWFRAELEDEDAVAEVVAAFREQLPMRSGLEEMREVAVELRYEPGFERWLVALDATEYAIDLCGEGARQP